jgi:hypothetical protein
MDIGKRVRRIHSVTDELLIKSREAILSAVQIFNNPLIRFKSEQFVVLSVISWTYLLHAYYRQQKVDYRYFKLKGSRKYYDKTKNGAFKYWELEKCVKDPRSPLDGDVKNNLLFLIGIRHEIEHKLTTRIDDKLSAKFQAACVNYNDCVKRNFGERFGIDRYLSISLQFASVEYEQFGNVGDWARVPDNISHFVSFFERELTDSEFNSIKFAYRVLFVPKVVSKKGQADRVIEFVKPDSELAESVNSYVMLKEVERPKYLPKKIVELMRDEGFSGFTVSKHTDLWKARDAKDPSKGYGVRVMSTWYWYDSWLKEVRDYCQNNLTI